MTKLVYGCGPRGGGRSGLGPGLLQELWKRALPPSCVICRARGDAGLALCASCREDLPWQRPGCPRCGDPRVSGSAGAPCGSCQRQPPAFQRVIAPLAYRPPVDEFIRRWKYQGQLPLGPMLAALWVAGCAPSAATGLRPHPHVNLLVPVPLHRSRLLERGFNQSLEFGRCLSRRLGITLAARCLIRRRAGVSQSLLTAADRRRSQRGVFAVDPARTPAGLAGARVALLDDVVTTGSTANACAEKLLDAGAAQVEVWAISRA